MKGPPSQAASLAATQAFLANRASVGNLSNAAAAAALRSHTTTPTPVGQVQTKRMQKRGSISSNGSAPERPSLLRRTSSGSMTERTFRDPSPSRPASSHGPYTHTDEPPPVPALPKNIPRGLSSMSPQTKAARRAASVEPPDRISSPPPRIAGGRGSSLDRGPGDFRPNGATAKSRVSSLNSVGEMERAGNRNSVNFSRPMSPQNSPPTSPLAGGRVKSPPPSRSTGVAGLANYEADNALGSIQETAAAPVKKKKKAISPKPTRDEAPGKINLPSQSETNARLSTSQPQPLVRPPGQFSDAVSFTSTDNQLPKPKKKKKRSVPAASSNQDSNEGFGNAYPSDTDSVTSERSSTTEKARTYTTRAAGLLVKQPSVVREDREAEEQEEGLPTLLIGKTSGKSTANGKLPAVNAAYNPTSTQKSTTLGKAAILKPPSKGSQQTSLDVPGAARNQSLSPARSTHFSSQPEYESPDGVKHQPPARSVSPAKSALKHSPSRGHSPIGGLPAVRRAGVVASEASDTASNFSDDGSQSRSKKKNVRVSFDDEVVAVGRAASPPLNSDSPIIMSPQSKTKSRSWYDLIKEKKPGESIDESDQGGQIKPTPTLPSFGSIRRDRPNDSRVSPVIDGGPREGLAQDESRFVEPSSDQVIGSLIAQDAMTKLRDSSAQSNPQKSLDEPLPPEATSVEGNGSYSDDGDSLQSIPGKSEHSSLTASSAPQATPFDTDNLTNSTTLPAETASTQEPSTSVPTIALQPATPALESSSEGQKEWLEMPGGFPDVAEPSDGMKGALSATLGPAESKRDIAIARNAPGLPAVAPVVDGSQTQIDSHSGDESDDTNGSIYSDAAEDPDDLEGDGFGSINAIIESPAPSPTVPGASQAPSNAMNSNDNSKNNVASARTIKPSPLTRVDSEMSEPASDEGWDRAQAYWSGLSQERRRQLEHAAIPGALDDRVIPNKTMRGPESIKKKKKKVPKTTSPPPTSNLVSPYSPTMAQNTLPPAKSPLRGLGPGNTADQQKRSSKKYPSSGDPQGSQVRMTTRDGSQRPSLSNGPQKPSTQNRSESKGTLQKKTRPVSAVAMVDYNPAAPALNHKRASSAGFPQSSLTPVIAQPKKKATAPKPPLRRNDSDSSSSFKKERPKIATSGKYTMKRTMRPSSMDMRAGSPVSNRAPSLSARTASPVGSTTRRPFSSVGPGGGGMRTSMRDSADFGKPPTRTSLRESAESNRTKSPSRFGFGKSSKTKLVATKPVRFSSRFGDSSDEEDSRPALSSRFADSSDDEPTELTPVRGIPRRIDEGDSTDLEDSSVEHTPASMKPKANGIKSSGDIKSADTKLEGLALATGSLHVASGDGPASAMGTGLKAKKAADKDKRKRSFFGGLGSKKHAHGSGETAMDSEPPGKVSSLEPLKIDSATSAGVLKDGRVLGPSSPRADPVGQPERPVMGSRTSSAQNSPKSPKLQRRNTPKTLPRANEISWPLPQSQGGTMSAPDYRPRTSDGAAAGNGTGRPDIGARRTTIQEPPAPTAPLVVGKSEKKKRFGMLRKALGMHA